MGDEEPVGIASVIVGDLAGSKYPGYETLYAYHYELARRAIDPNRKVAQIDGTA